MSEQLSIFDNDDDDNWKTVFFSVRYPKLARRVWMLRQYYETPSNPSGSTPVHDSLELVLRSASRVDVPDWKIGESIKRMTPNAYEFFISLKGLIESGHMEDYGEGKELKKLFEDVVEEPQTYGIDVFLEELAGVVSVNEVDSLLGMSAEKVAKMMYEAIEPHVNKKAGK